MTTQDNWPLWILVLRKLAETGEFDLWPYINPHSKTPLLTIPTLLILPKITSIRAEALTIVHLNTEERVLYKLVLEQWKLEYNKAKSIRQRVQEILK